MTTNALAKQLIRHRLTLADHDWIARKLRKASPALRHILAILVLLDARKVANSYQPSARERLTLSFAEILPARPTEYNCQTATTRDA